MNVSAFYLHVSRLCEINELSERQLSIRIADEPNYLSSTKAQKRIPSWGKFEAICEAFGLTPAQFFAGMEENDAVSDSLYVHIKELTGKLEQDDAKLLIRYVKRLTPAYLHALAVHLREMDGIAKD